MNKKENFSSGPDWLKFEYFDWRTECYIQVLIKKFINFCKKNQKINKRKKYNNKSY